MDIGAPDRGQRTTDNDTLTYSLDATGAESFDIDASSGQLRTKVALDHEDQSPATAVTASVRDSKDDNGDADEVTDDTITVTILVADLNEAPVFTPIEPNLRTTWTRTRSRARTSATRWRPSDDDGDTLTYSLDVSSRATFDIVSTTGQLQTKAALDYENGTSTAIPSPSPPRTRPARTTPSRSPSRSTTSMKRGRSRLSTTQPIEDRPAHRDWCTIPTT